jgi:hypothetical protein
LSVQTIRGVKWFPVQDSNFAIPDTDDRNNPRPGTIAASVNGAVALWSDGAALWYRIGTINAGDGTVSWGAAQAHTAGSAPCLALNDSNVLVEVHNSAGGGTDLWMWVGVVDFAAGTVKWTYSPPPGHNYDVGTLPSVALNNGNQIIEAHSDVMQTRTSCGDTWGR